jgi:hypothetical protein
LTPSFFVFARAFGTSVAARSPTTSSSPGLDPLETGVDRHLELRAHIKRCDARIDRDIRSDPSPDSRDIAVEWPKVWLNGVPIPVEPVEE